MIFENMSITLHKDAVELLETLFGSERFHPIEIYSGTLVCVNKYDQIVCLTRDLWQGAPLTLRDPKDIVSHSLALPYMEKFKEANPGPWELYTTPGNTELIIYSPQTYGELRCASNTWKFNLESTN